MALKIVDFTVPIKEAEFYYLIFLNMFRIKCKAYIVFDYNYNQYLTIKTEKIKINNSSLMSSFQQ